MFSLFLGRPHGLLEVFCDAWAINRREPVGFDELEGNPNAGV